MFMTPWKSLAPWVLLLVQESYLLYINSGYKNLVYKIDTTIPKNHMQTTLDAIIGGSQSAAIKNNNITHIFYHLNFEFFRIFHRVDWDFTAFVSLLCHNFVICNFILSFPSLVMETNLFTRLKLLTPISKLKLKKWPPI